MSAHSKYFTVAAAIVGVMAAATLLAFTEDRNAGWQLRPSLSLNQVHFVVRHSFGFDNWTSGRDVPLDRFRGFSLSMLASPGPAKFEYVADAGRLLCEGLRASSQDLIALKIHGVDTAFLRDLKF